MKWSNFLWILGWCSIENCKRTKWPVNEGWLSGWLTTSNDISEQPSLAVKTLFTSDQATVRPSEHLAVCPSIRRCICSYCLQIACYCTCIVMDYIHFIMIFIFIIFFSLFYFRRPFLNFNSREACLAFAAFFVDFISIRLRFGLNLVFRSLEFYEILYFASVQLRKTMLLTTSRSLPLLLLLFRFTFLFSLFPLYYFVMSFFALQLVWNVFLKFICIYCINEFCWVIV